MNGKIKLLLFIGIFTTALPILGFPRTIKTIILFVLGISSILLTLSLKRGIKTLRLKLKRIEGQQGTLIQ
jgi:hypothetical protein